MMFNRLSKYFLILSAAWLLTACQSTVDEPEENSCDITFTTEVLSRSSLISNSNITDYNFAVYGDMTRKDKLPEDKPFVSYNGAEVSYSHTSHQWIVDQTRFWIPEFQHSFVSYLPAGSDNISEILYSDSQLSFTYTQPSEYDKAEDVLIAGHRREYNEGITDAVRFKFGHILTSLDVEMSYLDPVMGKNTSLIVTGMTLKNIPSKAKYAITPAPLNGSDRTDDLTFDEATDEGWTINERGDLHITFPTSGLNVKKLANNGESNPLFNSNDELIVLPNTNTPTDIVLSYMTVDESGKYGDIQTGSVTVPNGWRPGRRYKLSLSINLGLVLISVEVEEWKDGASTETTVPRK